MALFWHTVQSYHERMDQLPPPVDQQAIEAPAVPDQAEVTSLPAAAIEAAPSIWATFEPLAPVAAQAAGRVVVDSLNSGLAAEQDVLDQATLELAQAAGVIARDESIPADKRCTVITDMSHLVGQRSVLKDRAEARRYGWAEKLLGAAVGAGVLAVLLEQLRRRSR